MQRQPSWINLVCKDDDDLQRHPNDHPGQDFKRVGLSTLNDLLNVVAPPISEHEVIQVWLSHDMQGYDGIETLVYRSLARVSRIHPIIRSPCLAHCTDHGASPRW